MCGSQEPLTGEHVYAAWIGRCLKFKSERSRYYLSLNGVVEDHEVESDFANNKLKVLCAECNNIWGSDLQDKYAQKLKAHLRGEVKFFNQDEIYTLAEWAALFQMIRQYVHPTLLSIPSETLREFRKTKKLPEGLYIWIAGQNSAKHEVRSWYRATPTTKLLEKGGFSFGLSLIEAGALSLLVLYSNHSTFKASKLGAAAVGISLSGFGYQLLYPAPAEVNLSETRLINWDDAPSIVTSASEAVMRFNPLSTQIIALKQPET